MLDSWEQLSTLITLVSKDCPLGFHDRCVFLSRPGCQSVVVQMDDSEQGCYKIAVQCYACGHVPGLLVTTCTLTTWRVTAGDFILLCDRIEETTAGYRARGLPTREVDISSGELEVLGVVADFGLRQLRLTVAVIHCINQTRASGMMFEVHVGQRTYCGLLASAPQYHSGCWIPDCSLDKRDCRDGSFRQHPVRCASWVVPWCGQPPTPQQEKP